jgi:hypothetical protein
VRQPLLSLVPNYAQAYHAVSDTLYSYYDYGLGANARVGQQPHTLHISFDAELLALSRFILPIGFGQRGDVYPLYAERTGVLLPHAAQPETTRHLTVADWDDTTGTLHGWRCWPEFYTPTPESPAPVEWRSVYEIGSVPENIRVW